MSDTMTPKMLGVNWLDQGSGDLVAVELVNDGGLARNLQGTWKKRGVEKQKSLSVRVFHRHIKVNNLVLPIWVVIARRK